MTNINLENRNTIDKELLKIQTEINANKTYVDLAVETNAKGKNSLYS